MSTLPIPVVLVAVVVIPAPRAANNAIPELGYRVQLLQKHRAFVHPLLFLLLCGIQWPGEFSEGFISQNILHNSVFVCDKYL